MEDRTDNIPCLLLSRESDLRPLIWPGEEGEEEEEEELVEGVEVELEEEE